MLKDGLNTSRRPLVAGLVLGGAHALLFALAFPPVGLWGLALVALLPLVWAARSTTRPWRTGLGVFLASVPMWAFHQQYAFKSTSAGFVPLVLYLALYPGLFVALAALVRRRLARVPMVVLCPVLWVGLEVVRGEIVFHGYPWFLIAQPLIEMNSLASYAPIVGAYGVSLWVATLAGWIIDLAAWWRLSEADRADRAGAASGPGLGVPSDWTIRLVGAVLMLVLVGGAGAPTPVPPSDAPRVRVGVVQTNLEQDLRGDWTFEQRLRDFERFIELTVSAARDAPNRPDLIVWPETMFPGLSLTQEAIDAQLRATETFPGKVERPFFAQELLEAQRVLGVPMIVGTQALDGLRLDASGDAGVRIDFDRRFNSAVLLERGAVAPGRYDKMHLTPFGEVMPYISSWPWLERQVLALGAHGMSFDLDAGRVPTRLTVFVPARGTQIGMDLRVAAPICFEGTMPGVCRRLVMDGERRGADLMVQLTNDGWFYWQDSARKMHLLLARWRCLELGTPMVRAANTGLSAAIDAGGKVLVLGPNLPAPHPAGPARTDGVLYAEIQLPGDRTTIYARHGDVVGWLCLGAAAAIGILAWVRPRPAGPALTGRTQPSPSADRPGEPA